MHLTHHDEIRFPEFSHPLVRQKVSDLPPEHKAVAREARRILNQVVQLRKQLSRLTGKCTSDDTFVVHDSLTRRHQCTVCGDINPSQANRHRKVADGKGEKVG